MILAEPIFIPMSLWFSFFCFKLWITTGKKNTASIRECAQLLLRERRRPGGLGWMDLAAVLCCWCSSDCREEKGEEGREGSSAVLWMLARVRVTVALEVMWCVSGKVRGGEKHVHFLISRDFSPPAFPSYYCWRAQRLCLCICLSHGTLCWWQCDHGV